MFLFDSQGASIPQRWIFALMCFLALFNAYAMRACLSIAITEMVSTTKVNTEKGLLDDTCPSFELLPVVANETRVHHRGTFDWSEYTQVWLWIFEIYTVLECWIFIFYIVCSFKSFESFNFSCGWLILCK